MFPFRIISTETSLGMAFNSQYCVVVDNDDFKNGAKIQLPLGGTINGGSVRVTNPVLYK